MLQPLWPAHRHLEIVHEAIRQRVDPAMDRDGLTARPGLPNEDVGGDIAHLAHDIELAEAVEARALLGDRLELGAMRAVDLADGMEPVIDEAAPPAIDRRRDATAA